MLIFNFFHLSIVDILYQWANKAKKTKQKTESQIGIKMTVGREKGCSGMGIKDEGK